MIPPQEFILDKSSNSLVLTSIIQEKQFPINIIIQHNENHYSGICKINDIINFGWVNWKYNRAIIDTNRIANIEQYINEQQSIDWLLYFAYCHSLQNIEDSILEIYDGFHRMTALQNYIVNYEKSNQMRCPFREATILISIRLFPSKKEIVNAFIALNQSIPVKDFYKDIIVCDCRTACACEFENYKAKYIENAANIWISEYNSHFKDSKKPIIPNITKNDFLDLIENIYDYFAIHTEIELIDKLYEINEFIKNKTIGELPSIKNFTEKALEKCKKTGCFLFLIKRELLTEYIKCHFAH